MTMVERVARAIWDQREAGLPERVRETWDREHTFGSVIKEAQREHCRQTARAAIAAMREPTVGMTQRAQGLMPVQTRYRRDHEGHHVDVVYPGDPQYVSPVGVWYEYIDSALAEAAPEADDEPDGDDYADRAEWKTRL